MACYSTTKYGFGNLKQILASIDSELITAHGGKTYFTKKYHGPCYGSESYGNISIYESTTDIDPLANYTPVGTTITSAWRLAFWMHEADLATPNLLTVHAGTELQYPDSGNVTFMNNRASNQASLELREPPGTMTANVWSSTSAVAVTINGISEPLPKPDYTVFNEVWLNRRVNLGSELAYPMNYTLTLTNRGIFLSIWEDNQEEVPGELIPSTGYTNKEEVFGNSPLRWFLVQRSVDRVLGHIRGGEALRGNADPVSETSRCPVFAVFGSGIPNQFRKFVVRELDVLTPSPKKFVTLATEDSPAMINKFQQQSLTETGEFVVTFVNNLSTSRYRYGDELDMLGTVGAEVVGPGTAINVKVYGETNNRTYTALYANQRFGKGMRLMALTAANSSDEDSHD